MIGSAPALRQAPTAPAPQNPAADAARLALPNTSTFVDASTVRIGVGIDTARYGHYAAFIRADLQPAAAELAFTENALGYAQLRERFEAIRANHPHVHFHVRLDAAGQYADNLTYFLQSLAGADGNARGADATPLANAAFTLSCGDP